MAYENEIYYSVIIASTVSLISCGLLIAAIVIVKGSSSLSYKLILYLTISDIFTSVGFLLPNSPLEVCYIQAFLINFSILSSIMFTAVILNFLHWTIVLQNKPSMKLEIFYLVIAWVLPCALSVIPIITKSYKNTSGWCWIYERNLAVSITLQLVEGFAIAFFVLVYNIITLIKINKKLKSELAENEREDRLRKKLMKRMIYYPLVLLICILPAGIYRILESKGVDSSIALKIIAADGQCLLGFGNAIVYGFTENLKKKVKLKFKLIDYDESAERFSANNVDYKDS
ncbi:hypothetical protein SteCoe_28671 [Stentor coeruleus]|uniref:G-protein coupled receptors family 2 profile 2 domain-containing protein n=1 Tax=Stentor coeruleus TaxID=5963 RepID=A0A1R2B7Q8_9CILI|nr:hypothetical protein SteCoe_28671 [Stentor coeruleus]